MRKWFALTLVTLLFTSGVAARAEDDWVEDTPYYEDDAWYDISEWFDGNDYNPTDEVAGRWDDEVYSAEDDTGSDQDNDTWYGYDTRAGDNNDNWFYDYYDYFPYSGERNTRRAQGNYNYTSAYYDFDGDGYYDAYSYGVDQDGDGRFDSVGYYSFNDAGRNGERQARKSSGNSSQVQQVSGTIERIKNVHVGNRQHILLEVRDEQGQNSFVDVGRGMKLKDVTLERGNHIDARGPKVKVGQRSVVIAQQITSEGRSTEIDRSGKTYRGEIAGTRTQRIRGVNRRLVILMNPETRTKRIVDLGPADKLNLDLQEGDQVSVTGVPVKIGNRRLVLANRINANDQQVSIDRQRIREQRTGRGDDGDGVQRNADDRSRNQDS
jgi:hypothetical protein